MRKIFTKVLAVLSICTLGVALGACSDKNKGTAPTLTNVTADVMDSPVAVDLADAQISSVTIDGKELAAKDYKVIDGTFKLANKYYGELGVGEHTVVFNFSNFDSQTITITVTDTKELDYTMPTVSSIMEASVETELPAVTLNKKYQQASIVYTLTNSASEVVMTAGNGQTAEVISSAEGFAIGDYTYDIEITRAGSVVEEKSYAIKFAEKDGNIFGVWSEGLWTAGSDKITTAYDATEDSYKITLNETYWNEKVAAPVENEFMIDMNASYFYEMYQAGYTRMEFQYRSNFESEAVYQGNPIALYGFIVYLKDPDGNIINGGTNYRSVLGCMGTHGNHNELNSFLLINTEKWQNMWIDIKGGVHTIGFDLDDIFVYENEYGQTIETISLAFSADAGKYIEFRQGTFLKAEDLEGRPDPTPVDPEDPVEGDPTVDYAAKDYFAEDNLANIKIQAKLDTNMKSVEWDATNSAIKVVRGGDNTVNDKQFTSANNRIYIDDVTMLEAYTAGYTKFTFEYNSSLTDGATAGGFYGFSVRKNGESNKVGAEVLQISQANGKLVTGAWTKVEVDLTQVYTDNTVPAGLSIVVCGNSDSTILFRNGHMEKPAPAPAVPANADIFTADYSWKTSDANGVKAPAFDATENATKLVVNNPNAELTARRHVAYLSIDTLKAMYANGMDTLTFSAKASADAELRIFAKKNDGLDDNHIADGKATGVKVYQDYTLTAEYATYTIDLADFFALADAADINYIGIVVKGASATEVFLKGATFSATQA